MTTFDYAQMSDDQVASIMQNLTDKEKGKDQDEVINKVAKRLKLLMDEEN